MTDRKGTCMNKVRERITESIEVKNRLLDDEIIIGQILKAGELVGGILQTGGKVLLCGNGGSASDSLHIAGEIVGRFQKERRSLPAIALPADVASMTAIANDYSYDDVFARETEGLMNDKDVLIGISTSGNSENVYRAMKKAKEIGGKTIALLGKSGGRMKDEADIAIFVPSDVTARIQESHIMIGHIICEIAEMGY